MTTEQQYLNNEATEIANLLDISFDEAYSMVINRPINQKLFKSWATKMGLTLTGSKKNQKK